MAALTPFATAFLDLPPELRTHILTYLAPDELGVLARSFPPCAGIESDGYLRAVWFHKTVPSRVQHTLSSRPDPPELARRGTLRGARIVAAALDGGYWASPMAVRISAMQDQLQQAARRRLLNAHLASRPSRPALVAAGILPPSSSRTSAALSARAVALDTALARCRSRRALRALRPVQPAVLAAWVGDAGRAERVRLALCPSVKSVRRFFETLVI